MCGAEAVIPQSIKRLGYGLETREIKVRFQAGEIFSLLASYPTGAGVG
jgi:hypothetical protein